MLSKEQILAIDRPQPKCRECGAPIEELERHPTRLVVRGEAPERSDFCPDCWASLKDEAYDSYWETKRPKKDKRLPKLTRREKALAVRALFESLWEQREREDVDVHLYFLSHLLMKWGGLRWRRSDADEAGRELVVFENPATGDELEIRSVAMNEEAVVAVKERVEAFLRDHAPDNAVTL